jgi:hypothetical protein
LPYTRRDSLLSRGELAFFWALRRAIGGRFGVSFKTRLADIVHCPEELWESIHGRKLCQKHVDFVLYDRRTMSVLLAIELDDASHDQPERRRRDKFVDEVFRGIGLPLLRVKAAFRYNVVPIQLSIDKVLCF